MGGEGERQSRSGDSVVPAAARRGKAEGTTPAVAELGREQRGTAQ